MKAAIIILGNSWVCPYVNTYKRAFEKSGYSYDVILWDRDGSDSCAPFRFCSGNVNLDNLFVKAVSYLRYSRFIKRTVLKNKYDRLVVSGPHLAVLLSSFLRKKYKGRYIIDYRDISVEQKPLLGRIYSGVLADSYCNVISSQGFKKYLPSEYKYLISHNFNLEIAESSLESCFPERKKCNSLKILTIGYIRNYSSNVKVVQALENRAGFSLRFAGRGDAADELHKYVLSHGVTNAVFTGFYKKDEEESIVAACDFINIFFPDDIEHSVIMSNRFYLALIYKKPMIVTAGSVQAALVSEYGLGVVTPDCENLDEEINEYLSNFEYQTFCEKCNELLASFVEEHRELECAIADFMQT